MTQTMQVLIRGMIYLGSALMVYNIIRYYGFVKKMQWMRDGVKNTAVLYTPLVLLIFFLGGYLTVGVFGDPDLIMAGILFGGSVFVFIILHILYYVVERVQNHEQLQHELREAKHASEAKTVFLSNMSHDIRTPLNAILGYAQLAERDSASEEERREFIGKIRSSGQHLLALINDVLEMSRIESGRIELENTETNLCEVFHGVQEMFGTQMEQKRISFSVEARNVTDRYVLCDRNRLNRILLNLVSNACKFTPEGGTVTVTVTQTESREGRGDYVIRVRDNGIGMTPEFARKVFESFERERTSTVSGIEGTGLGMAITKSIVEQMGGSIRVETAPGAGTEFEVCLSFPVLPPPEGAGEADCSSAQGEPEPMDFHGRKLLLAEDNPVNREIACMILQESGFELEIAEDGKKAVELLASAPEGEFDAVLMDVQMPVMNGYDASRAIRKLPDPARAGIPIIAMTANAFREDMEREKEAGMDAHISKPLDVPEMLAILSEVLRKADGGRHREV